MRVPRRLLAVLLFAIVGLLALAFSGLLDWITSILFLILEFLAEFLRPLLGRRRKSRQSDRLQTRGRYRLPGCASGHASERHRLLAHRKRPPRRRTTSSRGKVLPASSGRGSGGNSVHPREVSRPVTRFCASNLKPGSSGICAVSSAPWIGSRRRRSRRLLGPWSCTPTSPPRSGTAARPTPS